MKYQRVVGDLQVNDEDWVDGWCWDPERPARPVRFEILVDDRLVGSGLAALPRPDLVVHGLTNTAHGYALKLPPGAIDRTEACLVSARSRDSGVVFGRKRIEAAAAATAPCVLALQAVIGMMSERLAKHPKAIVPRRRWRQAVGELGERLRAPACAAFRGPAGRPAESHRLSASGRPAVTLVLPAATAVVRTRTLLSVLAAEAAAFSADVVLLDARGDPQHRLLPGQFEGLRRVESWPEAVGTARSAWIVLLDSASPGPFGIETLVPRLACIDVPVLLRPPVEDGLTGPVLAAEAPAGVLCAIRRDLARGSSRAAALTAAIALP